METDDPAVADVRERYARFGVEASARSAVYAEWAAGVAGDVVIAAVLARIPATHRQPPLVFAVTRMLGAPLGAFGPWASWVEANADAVVAECSSRSMQTNEPLRCAVLLPALTLVEGPIALLEVGAAAGLCLFPDAYGYRYLGASETVSLDPAHAPSAVVLECDVRGRMPVVRLPEIVWRAGIDLRPLDAREPADRVWLTGLVWPGEEGRVERMTAALDIAAASPPLLFTGDAAEVLERVADRAPSGATLVVTTPGVLAHLPRAGRDRIISTARRLGRWVTIDAPGLHDAWTAPIDSSTWPAGGFALALDGEVLAAADPLGGWLEWRREDPSIAR
jgi:hypothetical protein